MPDYLTYKLIITITRSYCITVYDYRVIKYLQLMSQSLSHLTVPDHLLNLNYFKRFERWKMSVETSTSLTDLSHRLRIVSYVVQWGSDYAAVRVRRCQHTCNCPSRSAERSLCPSHRQMSWKKIAVQNPARHFRSRRHTRTRSKWTWKTTSHRQSLLCGTEWCMTVQRLLCEPGSLVAELHRTALNPVLMGQIENKQKNKAMRTKQ